MIEKFKHHWFEITSSVGIVVTTIFLLWIFWALNKGETKCQAGVITITELRKEIEKRKVFYLNDGGEYQLRFTPNGCVKVIKNKGRR